MAVLDDAAGRGELLEHDVDEGHGSVAFALLPRIRECFPKSDPVVHVDTQIARTAIVGSHVASRGGVFLLKVHFATAFFALHGILPFLVLWTTDPEATLTTLHRAHTAGGDLDW